MQMYSTMLTSEDTYRSIPDRQLISFNYNSRNERQTLDLTALGGLSMAIPEVQTVTMSTRLGPVLLCFYDACLPSFSPSLLDLASIDESFKDMMGSTGNVTVDASPPTDTVQLRFTYPSDLGNAPLMTILDATSMQEIATVTKTEVTRGQTAASGPWRSAYKGVPSSVSFSLINSTAEVSEAIRSTFFHLCPSAITAPDPTQTFLYEDYENATTGSSDKAFCGYYSRPFHYNIGGKSNNFFLDSLYIGSKAIYKNTGEVPLYVRKPKISVNEVIVTQIEANKYNLEFVSKACANSFDLVGFAGVAFSGSSDFTANIASSRDISWPSDSVLTTTRAQSAGIFPTGFYRLSFGNQSTQDIEVYDVKSLMLQMLVYLDIGRNVEIQSSEDCKAPTLTVSFVSLPGIQNLLTISDQTQLIGTEALVTVSKLTDGHLSYDPMPTDMLQRIRRDSPQVNVEVNHSPAACENVQSCSISYNSNMQAPTINSIILAKNQTDNTTSIMILGTHLFGEATDIHKGDFYDPTNETELNLATVLNALSDSQVKGSIVDDLSVVPAGTVNFVLTVGSRGTSNMLQTDLGTEFAAIQSISPIFSFLQGGLILNITGTRFSLYTSSVKLGNLGCPVLSRSPTMISCVVPKSTLPGSVEVKVNQYGIEITGSNGPVNFEYVATNIPVISYLSESVIQGLDGNTEIQLFGSNLQATDLVVIGSETINFATFIDSTTAIFIAPAVTKSQLFFVRIYRPGLGYSTTSSPLEYSFLVNGISGNLYGSWMGGTSLTIKGVGLTRATAKVFLTVVPASLPHSLAKVVGFRSSQCEIVSSSSGSLTIKTGALQNNIVIQNNATHPQFGLGFQWSNNYIKVIQGDIVTWVWTVQSTQQIGLIQLNSLRGNALNATETVFKNSSISTQGAHSVYFGQLGTYYFANVNLMEMLTVVEVVEVPSLIARIEVKSTGGYHASYSNVAASYVYSPTSSCIENNPCQDLSLYGSSQYFTFAVQNCLTPKIQTMSPVQITAHEPILVTSLGLSKCLPRLLLKIGMVTSSLTYMDENSPSDLFQKALYTDANPLNYGVPYKGSLLHQDYGYSLVTKLSMYPSLPDQYFFILPGIQGFSIPMTGSILGGAQLVILATGLDYKNSQNNAVMIGSKTCQLISITYGQIICAVPNLGTINATNREETVSLTVASIPAKCVSSCKYRYDVAGTSIINSVNPTLVTSCQVSFTFTGSFIATQTSLANLTVFIGQDVFCRVSSYTGTTLQCRISSCLVAGNHSIRFMDPLYGYAIVNTSLSITSLSAIEYVNPNQGSLAGFTTVNISGNALTPAHTVLIGSNNATIISQDAQSSSITILTPAGPAAGSKKISIIGTSGIQIASLNEGYTYSDALTPKINSIVSSVSASNASFTQTLVQITGSNLKPSSIPPSLILKGNNGQYACLDLVSATNTQIQCLFASLPADVYEPLVVVPDLGLTTSSATLNIDLSIITNLAVSVGTNGGQIATIEGIGFAGTSTAILICNQQAKVLIGNSYRLSYRMPASVSGDNTCDLTVKLPSGANVKMLAGVNYRGDQNPTVIGIEPSQGGTGGGTIVNITGTKFGTDPATKVRIAGAACNITSISDTLIVCVTGPVDSTMNSTVVVTVANVGNAVSAVSFYYVDKWSSVFTWGGTSLPIDGDFVSIPRGKIVMLDMDTPVLSVLLIDGGKLFFDPHSSVTLNAKYILIINGGTLEIGTEDQPHLQKSGINLFGNFMDKELPLYGAKVLGLRNGTIDIHGKPHTRVWTRLAHTAQVGATQINLQQPVDWIPGDEVVFTSTGRNGSIEENEQRTLKAVSADGLTLTLSTPLKYKKLGVEITFDELGPVLFCAKVGLLTHNVKIQGLLSLDLVGNLQKCPPGFVPDTFFTQSCLMDGNLAEMPGFNNYGGQIIVSAAGFSTGSVTMRITGTELYKMGQAFRLGRYPIHYHMNGFMSGSFVKQCSIHKAFNRAVNIHKTNQIIFEETVAFDIMGGAFFLEDSVEILNEIRNNLFILCRASNSLLNDDVTPAAFWITNPNNIIAGNVAAGGTHFGFWYRMLEHPTGPSFNTSYCPRVIPLGIFEDNESHSQGWFGLWIHDSFFPTSDGLCRSRNWAQAVFNNFLTWNNGKGAECVNCGAVTFQNMIAANNRESGLEWHLIKFTSLYQMNPGPSFSDSHVIGFLPQLSNGQTTCDTSGIVLPWPAGFTLSNITFHHFEGPTCRTIRGTVITCICNKKCGGYITNVQNLRYYNCDNRGFFRWNADYTLFDVDGSISQNIPGLVSSTRSYIVSKSSFIPENDCPDDLTAIWAGSRGALRCKTTATPIRFSWNKAFPTSILSADVIMSLMNQSPEIVPWKKEGVTHEKGWMTVLIQGHRYQFSWKDTIDYTLFGYTGVMENFRGVADYVIIRHANISTKPDRVRTLAGTSDRELLLTPLDPATAANGDVYWDVAQNYLEYIVRATSFDGIQGSALLNFQTIRCQFPGCVQPLSFEQLSTATERPANVIYWSNASTWGNGSLMGVMPANGDILRVPSTVWLVIDVNLDANYDYVVIYGVLEIEHGTPSQPLNIHITTNQVRIRTIEDKIKFFSS
ncbi:Fibrocystin-L [Cichlidogyrus casuarinus]|uniref:Fibrocystin-L n=1 Tax=Cichlidogyrus casuarinus TaxID=1844966 RepID=A0ABD2QCT2_9PLAT